jgi:nucleoside-diphosphate-sugar epimerase
MRYAITGGTGFVGRNLASKLIAGGHEVVLISRGVDSRDTPMLDSPNVAFAPIGIDSVGELTKVFSGCDAVAHLGGINREIGEQTYANVHVQGTANVIEAAKLAGVSKVLFLSFLRARPNCGSPYHESKWEAEELVRKSGLDYTIFKAGVIYGKGDHMLDHITHALHTFPIFLLVGFRSQPVRPLAIEDLVQIMEASLVDGRLSRMTVPVTGPEEINLREVVGRIMRIAKRRPLVLPAPIWLHYAMAWFFERTMTVPLAAKAQVRILSESLVEPVLAPDALPADLIPRTAFTDEQIRKGLPQPHRFGFKDCLRRHRSGTHLPVRPSNR